MPSLDAGRLKRISFNDNPVVGGGCIRPVTDAGIQTDDTERQSGSRSLSVLIKISAGATVEGVPGAHRNVDSLADIGLSNGGRGGDDERV